MNSRSATPNIEPEVVHTVLDASSDLDFVWRNFRSYLGFKLRTWRNWLIRGHLGKQRVISEYLSQHADPKLHLGATYQVDGFLNSQILGNAPIDIGRRLPLPDNTFAMIYSSHLVEHVHRREFHRFLVDGLRVLRPDGVMVVAAPSVEKIATLVYGPDCDGKRQLLERGQSYMLDSVQTASHQMNLAMRGFGHRYLYDTEYMKWIGERVGYDSVDAISNFDVPDEGIRNYLTERKPLRWDAQTETWLFRKAK